jgi:hypothetical protein
MIFFIKLIVLLSSASIIFSSIVALNKMSFKTDHIIRLSHILMSGGALHEVFWITQAHAPNATELLLFGGVALLLIFDNRRAYQCPLMEANREHYS